MRTELSTQPYYFTEEDITPDRLRSGAEITLEHYYQWADTHPEEIAEHVDNLTEVLRTSASCYSLGARAVRAALPMLGRRFKTDYEKDQVDFFGVYNLGTVLGRADVDQIHDMVYRPARRFARTASYATPSVDPVNKMVRTIERRIPELNGASEVGWLGDRLKKLHGALPEVVIGNGGMGKVVRTMMGVLAIGAYDVLHEPWSVKREHLAHILPGAYFFGASYGVVDDTLQDTPDGIVARKDKEQYHQAIIRGLQTGNSIDPSSMPDHPISEELLELYGMLLDQYPFRDYRGLYYAAETMYQAQHNTSQWENTSVGEKRLTQLYPDLFLKSGLSRVVANMLGRRNPGEDSFYAHVINLTFSGQLKDDLTDRLQDWRDGTVTPFTYPASIADRNPLFDLFAYDAYVVRQVFNNDPDISRILTQFGAAEVGAHLIEHSTEAIKLLETYNCTPAIARFISTAAGFPSRYAHFLDPSDAVLKKKAGVLLGSREQTTIDPRTFVTDRLTYMNEVIAEAVGSESILGEVIQYSLEAGGKRLRPALTLMLAEGMGVNYASVEPLLQAVEMFHTSSLLFDDLPAQDNASLRRGRPTAHVAYDESKAQLAGIAMMSTGFGVLAKLGQHFQPERVNDVVQYLGKTLGTDGLCKGQALDLQMKQRSGSFSGQEVLEMYHLKTSTMIEASLVPLLMLTGRSANEIDYMKQYAYHAGIVFQIRDDILDATSSTEEMGKDVDQDLEQANVVRFYGLDKAQELMEEHLQTALQACRKLSFDTKLLQGLASHFATRHK